MTRAVRFPVPNVPSLVGASIHWPAVVPIPLALINLEITKLTSL